MLPIRNISYLLPMCCSFWEKCKKSLKTGLGCSTPLTLWSGFNIVLLAWAWRCTQSQGAEQNKTIMWSWSLWYIQLHTAHFWRAIISKEIFHNVIPEILDILILQDKTLFCAFEDNFKQNGVNNWRQLLLAVHVRTWPKYNKHHHDLKNQLCRFIDMYIGKIFWPTAPCRGCPAPRSTPVALNPAYANGNNALWPMDKMCNCDPTLALNKLDISNVKNVQCSHCVMFV